MENLLHENDIINLDSYKLNIEISKKPHNNETCFTFKGLPIDESVINSLRRTLMLYIPTYGFHRSNIKINNEESYNMYGNDMIYDRFENLPVFGITNNYYVESPEFYLNTPELRDDFSLYLNESYLKKDMIDFSSFTIDKIEVQLNLTNNSDKILTVTTHHLILKINDKISDNYKKNPSLALLFLKPNEKISVVAIANLGIERFSSIYEATTLAYFNKLTDIEYNLYFHTLNNTDDTLTLKKACKIISIKLMSIRTAMEEKNKTMTSTITKPQFKLELIGEDDTIGNLLGTVLQKCTYTTKAGYYRPHLYLNNITIEHELEDVNKISHINLLIKCINYLIDLFSTIESKL